MKGITMSYKLITAHLIFMFSFLSIADTDIFAQENSTSVVDISVNYE